jgi:hypothetical protein
MKREYDFRKAMRGEVVRREGRTRLTIHLDTDLLEELRRRADAAGRGYEGMINEAVRHHVRCLERPPVARRVEVTADELQVDLADGRRLSLPLAWFPRIRWSEADEDIDVAGLLRDRADRRSRPLGAAGYRAR